MTQAQSSTDTADAIFRQHIRTAFELLYSGRVGDARRVSDALLAERADNAEVQFLASEVRLAEDDAEGALGFILAAVVAAPGQLPLLIKKAENLIMLRRRLEAKQVAEEAIAAAGNDGKAFWEIAKIYSKCDDPASALPLYERALAIVGRHPELLYDLAVARFHTGDSAGAEGNIESLLENAPKFGHALYLRATLRRQTDARNHVRDLEGRLAAGFPTDTARAACLFALAKELEDIGQDEASFAALAEGAALKRQAIRYDVAAECASIDGIRQAYTQDVMATKVAGDDQTGAIFIVGMPRTGTTLVERMLGRHGEVGAAGELLDFGQALAAAARKVVQANPDKTLVDASLMIDFAALGRDYMTGARQAAPNCHLFIDKMPINFIYCGLIKKALPNARIIHLVRDPMDSCYAAYKTLFSQAYYFSYNFDELATYYTCYHRMMQHWHEVMPGAILDVRYEDIVADTERQARRILDWCGLNWQDVVLEPAANDKPSTTASAAQVREPIYSSSVRKWHRHEVALAPLKARLVAAGIVDAKD